MSSDLAPMLEGARKSFRAPFGGVLRVEATDQPLSLWVDGRVEGAPQVSEDAPPEVTSSFCLWRGEAQVLRSVLLAQRKIETAIIAGQLKVSGDMAVMARLEPAAGV
ncbi:SCP2 sterol-binding domain-containing protein [Parvularcula maris]|uniref:SCP2 sterol-binding domain-containing protein n=1 Tax=Parvularcula maris TaxID=2965077 RepID=A0A9X2LAI9_9PROT|nr:SCP2 sterol-binding domain-containing protein [Parvularcula maris]MCQ8186145.1 SCP2 sterol-binding domain-containing protein [Parvularcula maris]